MKLLVIISVNFDIIDYILIQYSALIRYWRKNENTVELVHHLFVDFKKAYDSVSREVLYYSILIEFHIPVELVSLIKMCLMKPIEKPV
jgi:hypothetical protein